MFSDGVLYDVCARDSFSLVETFVTFAERAFDVIQGGMCSIFIAAEEKIVSVPSEHLQPVTPQVNDKVSRRSSVNLGVSYWPSLRKFNMLINVLFDL